MIKVIRQLVCALKGHKFPTACFDNFSLCYCQRCGREVADRTFDDILPVPDDEDFPDYDRFASEAQEP